MADPPRIPSPARAESIMFTLVDPTSNTKVQVTVAKHEERPAFTRVLEEAMPKDSFSFQTGYAGHLDICLENKGRENGRVSVSTSAPKPAERQGPQDEMAFMEKQYRRAKKLIAGVSNEMDYMLRREMRMRQTSESTNGRVEWFSFASVRSPPARWGPHRARAPADPPFSSRALSPDTGARPRRRERLPDCISASLLQVQEASLRSAAGRSLRAAAAAAGLATAAAEAQLRRSAVGGRARRRRRGSPAGLGSAPASARAWLRASCFSGARAMGYESALF